VSRSKHRNLIIINTNKKILTFFEPNMLSSEFLNEQEYLEQEEIYSVLSKRILSEFKSIFPSLKLGLIWRNVSAVIGTSVDRLGCSELSRSRLNGWCTLNCYGFLDRFVTGNLGMDDADLLESVKDILERLSKFPNLARVYETNYISIEEISHLFVQIK
jgi:hypothetical protein